MKPYTCQHCTFINNDPKPKCEICMSDAPAESFLSENIFMQDKKDPSNKADYKKGGEKLYEHYKKGGEKPYEQRP